MKAVVWTEYGSPDVLQLRDVAKPVPGDNEVLIKVFATTVTTGDCEMRRLKFPYWIRLPMRFFMGLRKPTRVTILGSYLAGEIEDVGKDVSSLKLGDQVYGMVGMSFGAYAEYVCAAANGALAIKPANMTHEEAAPIGLGGLEALHFLRKANVQPGEKVLINGAGGSIGTFGIQLAKHFGAEVTAVDSAAKLNVLTSVGADHVIDFKTEDFTKSGQKYDVIFDVIGKSSFSQSVKALNLNGRYIIANPSGLIQFIRGKWASRGGRKRVIFEMTNPKTADLDFLTGLIESGKLKTIVDRQYPLEQIPDAHRYVESGEKIGNVIISVAEIV